MFKLVKTSVACICMATTSGVLADEIVVTAKGNQSLADVLHTTHVFSQTDIDAAQAKDIPALLDQLTGISVRDSGGRGSQTGVFLRGVSSSQTIVLIDGVRVGSATLGAAALNSYPVAAIERIEVVKGPFSGIYGADAVGGVIQLFTKTGGDGNGSVSATFGSDSLVEYGASFNGGDESNGFYLSAHSQETDGIDRTSILTDGNDDRDGFEQTVINLGGKVTVGQATVAKLALMATDSIVEFDNAFGQGAGLMTDADTLSAALSINSQLTSSLRWNTTLGTNEDESTTNGGRPSKFITNRDTLGSELEFSLAENSALTVGVDYYEEDIESSNEYPVTDRDNKGVYAQFRASEGSFDFVGSLRYDDNSAYGDTTNGSLALSYRVNENLRAVISYGSAFVAPSFNFLYFPFFGNPDILPEESDSVEASLLGNLNNFDWRVSVYQSDITNLFSFDPETFLAANIGEAEIEGLEIELDTRLAEWTLGLNADLLSAEDKETGGKLDDRAGQTLALTAARTYGNLDLRFDIKSERKRYDNSGTELSGYGLLDVSAKYQISDQFSISANIDNLFDKDYTVNLIGASQRYNTEGRQAKLTFKYSF